MQKVEFHVVIYDTVDKVTYDVVDEVEVDNLPPKVRIMLQQFQNNFCIHDYIVTHYYDDAVSIRIHGTCNAYSVAKFIRNVPDIYIELELEATSPHHWTLRMFCDEVLLALELPDCLSWSQTAPAAVPLTHVKVRADANQ